MALQDEFELQGNYLFKFRGILPLIIILVGIIVFSIDRYNGILFNSTTTFYSIEIASLTVCLFGLCIRIYTVGHTPANTSGRNTQKQIADKLNTTGIYSVVRHPLYLGNFFMWLGMSLLTANVWFVISFILLYWIYYERIMYAEELFLKRKFGDEFIQWSSKTPAILVSFKNWKKSSYSFSWKKVLKKEKNGLLAIFVLLFVFHSIYVSFESNSIQAELNWIFYIAAAIAVLYLILKYIKKKTVLLNEDGR
jgi:protein-S-isoprenylcysteine O-methyltransferase Ste14